MALHINLSALEKAAGTAQITEQTVSFYHTETGNTPEEITMDIAGQNSAVIIEPGSQLRIALSKKVS